MKPINRSRPSNAIFRRMMTTVVVGSGILAVTSIWTAGCASTGYERAAMTSQTLTSAADQVDSARSEVTKATTALDSFNRSSAQDLRVQFKNYQSTVKALEHANADIQQKTRDMEAQGRK